jgi:catechol 2,3-dioxygenase-like lactoylglutathione lyase family enzyme
MFKSDHTAFAVTSLARSRAFYEHLGARVVSKPSPHFLEMMLGDLRLHMIEATDRATVKDGRLGIDHICVAVGSYADLVKVRDRINAFEGGSALAPFEIEDSEMLGDGMMEHAEERPPLKTLYARDPDGIVVEVRAYSR